MYFAVSVGMLGYTRIQSLVCYNSETRAFDELTPAIARRGIASGQVKGVQWKDNEDGGEFIPDVEGFNKHNIMVKTAAAKFRPLLNDLPGKPINSMYNVVRVLFTNYRGTLYEIVSNRYDRIKVTEEQLRQLNEISPVAGVWISDNEIKVADCIENEDRTGKLKEKTNDNISKDKATKGDGITGEQAETEGAEPVKMEPVFKETSDIILTEEQRESAYKVESGAGSNVSTPEEKVEENKVEQKKTVEKKAGTSGKKLPTKKK